MPTSARRRMFVDAMLGSGRVLPVHTTVCSVLRARAFVLCATHTPIGPPHHHRRCQSQSYAGSTGLGKVVRVVSTRQPEAAAYSKPTMAGRCNILCLPAHVLHAGEKRSWHVWGPSSRF
eukprot:1186248-Prorocentrum_minimum.AAC.2